MEAGVAAWMEAGIGAWSSGDVPVGPGGDVPDQRRGCVASRVGAGAMRCPTCDARNPDGASWCTQCYSDLATGRLPEERGSQERQAGSPPGPAGGGGGPGEDPAGPGEVGGWAPGGPEGPTRRPGQAGGGVGGTAAGPGEAGSGVEGPAGAGGPRGDSAGPGGAPGAPGRAGSGAGERGGPPEQSGAGAGAEAGGPSGQAGGDPGAEAGGPTEVTRQGVTFRRTGEGLDWCCPVCESWNPVEVGTCTVCSRPLAHSLSPERPAPRGPEVSENVGVVASALLPGLGHILAGRPGTGVGRAIIYLVWLIGGALLLRAARVSAQSVLPAVPLLVGALIVWVASLYDVIVVVRDTGTELLRARPFLWLVVIIFGILMISFVVTTLQLPGRVAS